MWPRRPRDRLRARRRGMVVVPGRSTRSLGVMSIDSLTAREKIGAVLGVAGILAAVMWSWVPMPVTELAYWGILVAFMCIGWYIVTTRGSHRQLRQPTKPGRVTVHGKPSDSIAPGTLNSILKQSGLKK